MTKQLFKNEQVTRITIPKKFLKELGLDGTEKVIIEVQDNQIIIKKLGGN